LDQSPWGLKAAKACGLNKPALGGCSLNPHLLESITEFYNNPKKKPQPKPSYLPRLWCFAANLAGRCANQAKKAFNGCASSRPIIQCFFCLQVFTLIRGLKRMQQATLQAGVAMASIRIGECISAGIAGLKKDPLAHIAVDGCATLSKLQKEVLSK